MKIMRMSLAVILTFALAAGITLCGVTVANATDYTASTNNTHAIEASGDDVSYSDITVTKTGNGSGDNADFYGENAAVYASDGVTLTITDADITTDGQYANGVFSYGEGTVINISDSTITTTQRNSGGIMVTGGGELNASNLTVVTEGGSSASIRSDRGGGTINVDGGSYTANGSGSPSIYSTADINVSNATLQSGSAQAVVVEGGNTVTLTDCDVTANNTVQNSDNSTYYQAVMLYQSMSGDAAGGDGSFTMTGGTLTSLNGGMFFVTNSTYTINLSDVDLTYADDELLRICAAGWGNSGSNGGQVVLNADSQSLEGEVIVDSISKLNMYLTDGSDFTGTFDNDGEVYVEISEGSTWTLTGDCDITSLTCDAGSINLNGYTLTINGVEYTDGSDSTGTAVEFTESLSGDKNNGSQPPEKPGEDGEMGQQDGSQPPEKPGEDGEMGQQDGNQPPAKPGEDGEMGQQDGNQPPEKPEGEASENPPEKPSEESGMDQPEGTNPPEKPSDDEDMMQPGSDNPPEKPEGEAEEPADKPDEASPAKPDDESGMAQPEGTNPPAKPNEDQGMMQPGSDNPPAKPDGDGQMNQQFSGEIPPAKPDEE